MNEARVIAVVVTYRPDEVALVRLLQRLAPQVHHTVVVDNTDEPGSSLPQPANGAEQTCLSLGHNTGIGHAQNLGVALARQLGATHVLFMDQDSLPPEDMVPRLLQSLTAAAPDQRVAAIGPLCRDIKTGQITALIQRRGWRIHRVKAEGATPIPVEYIPASGTLASLAALECVGLLRAEYFIDRVDMEWCLRAKRMGMSIWVDPRCEMQHDQATRAVRLLGRTLYIGSDFRAYFHVRNSVAMAARAAIAPVWRWDQIVKTLPYVVLYTLAARHGSLHMARTLLVAVLDGLRGRMGKGHYESKPLQ